MNRPIRRQVVIGLTTAVGIGLAAYAFAIRPWHRRWGASDEEAAGNRPGDEMVPDANFRTTRAITIDAPVEAVWPWLVQIGQGRCGFYAYDFLENMMGLNIHSAEQIRSEFHDLGVGDTISLETGGSGYTVAGIEPNHYLLLFADGTGDSEADKAFRQADAASTWTFVLKKLADGQTRLVVRWKARWDLSSSPTSLLIGLMLDPIEFLMEQKMMRGIRERSEAAAQPG